MVEGRRSASRVDRSGPSLVLNDSCNFDFLFHDTIAKIVLWDFF